LPRLCSLPSHRSFTSLLELFPCPILVPFHGQCYEGSSKCFLFFSLTYSANLGRTSASTAPFTGRCLCPFLFSCVLRLPHVPLETSQCIRSFYSAVWVLRRLSPRPLVTRWSFSVPGTSSARRLQSFSVQSPASHSLPT